MNHDLMTVMLPVGILGTISLGIYLFVKTLTDYFLRKRMVEKGYVDAESVAVLAEREKKDSTLLTLKWGLIVFFAGLGLIVIEFLSYGTDSPLPYGVFALSLSLGFLVHFFVSRKIREEKSE